MRRSPTAIQLSRRPAGRALAAPDGAIATTIENAMSEAIPTRNRVNLWIDVFFRGAVPGISESGVKGALAESALA